MKKWDHIYDINPCGIIPDLQNIEIVPYGVKKFVLILPGIFSEAFSAGPNTAFRFAAEISKLGYNILSISLQYPACTSEVLRNHLVSSLGIDYDVAKRFQVSDMTKKIILCHGDLVCATASWTLPSAIKIARKTGTQYPIYFIQDCEPCFWGWGPEHACLMEGYAENFLPVINTRSLAEMLFNIGTGSFSDNKFRERALIFHPAVDRSFFYREPRHSGKRILFVYTRFGEMEQRNMYQLALEAISRAVDKGLLPAERWEIHCYGAHGHAPVAFSSGIEAIMLPPLDMAAYAREIRQANLVLYLVLSPHTGYMPLEAASCGVPVVTNTYLNKNANYLRKISPLIIPACPTLDGVADALVTALLSLNKKRIARRSILPAIPATWSKSFAPIMPKVQEWLQRPYAVFEKEEMEMTKNDDIIGRWSPVRRFLAPMIARTPSMFWPASKAKALVAEGKIEEAKLVLKAHPQHGRARNLLERLEEKERAEEIAEERFMASSTHSLPPRVKGGASIYYVEILSECNLRCPLCAFGSKNTFERKHGKMELDYFIKILDKIKMENPHAMVNPYHHCEPLLHPQLPEMIREIRKRGFTCAVSSNFNNISRLEEVIDADLNSLEISVSGFYQGTYAKSHVGGDIEKVKENMRELRRIIDKLQSQVHINVIYHMYKDNIDDDFDAMKSFTESLNFSFFSCWSRSINLELSLKYLIYNNYSKCTGFKENWIDKNIQMSEEYIKSMDRIIYLPQDYINEYKDKILNNCPSNERFIHIKWNGNINLCGWAFDDRLVGPEYISTPTDRLYEIRRNHSVCKECLKNNFALYCNYFGMEEIDKRAIARLEPKYLGKCGLVTNQVECI